MVLCKFDVSVQRCFHVFGQRGMCIKGLFWPPLEPKTENEPRHEISNNVVCATSNGSDQPAHTHSLIRAFASRLNIL